MPSMEEQKDIDAMKAENTVIKERAFDELRYFVRGDLSFTSSGYKDLADACDKIVKDAMKQMSKVEARFLKKWPD